MKITIRAGRQRELMGVALKLYDNLAKGTQANLTSLNLPTMAVDTARAQNEAWKEKLATSANDLEITDDLRIHAKDAINFVLNSKYNKAEKQQIELLIDTQSTESTINELKALRRKFATQPDLELADGASEAPDEEPPIRPSEEGISEIHQTALAGAEA